MRSTAASSRRDRGGGGAPGSRPGDGPFPRRRRHPRFGPSNARRALELTLALISVCSVLDIVAQLLPPYHRPVTQAESDLAAGPFGYVMTINFVVRGVLALSLLLGIVTATSLGRRAPVGIALVGIWGLGAFVLAASPTDVGEAVTLRGAIHLATAALAFLAAAVGEFLLSLRFRDEPRLAARGTPALAISGLSVIVLLALLYVQSRPRLFDEAIGLVERVCLGLGLLWMLLVAVHLLRAGGWGPPAGTARRRAPAHARAGAPSSVSRRPIGGHPNPSSVSWNAFRLPPNRFARNRLRELRIASLPSV